MLENITHKSSIGMGWYKTEKGLRPLWYTVNHIPPSLKNRELNRTERGSDCQVDNEDSSDSRKVQSSHVNRHPRKKLHSPVIMVMRDGFDAEDEHDEQMTVLNHLTLTLDVLVVMKGKIILTIQTLVLIQTVMNFKYWCVFI